MERIRRTPLQSEIIEHIKKYIDDNNLIDGDKLPSQTKMVELLEVSRTSLREALKTLEAYNIIKIINGKGVYVSHMNKEDFQHDIEIEKEREILLDIIELRRFLEKEMIRLVINNATEADFNKVEKILNKLQIKTEQKEDTTKDDYMFHMSLYEITHNFAMEQLGSYMDKVFKRLWEYPLNMDDPFNTTLPLHTTLFHALKSGSRLEAEKISSNTMDMIVKEIKNAR